MTKTRLALVALVFAFVFGLVPRAHAAGSPVAILVNGFGDCCTYRMERLIDGLKSRGFTFAGVEARKLSGASYGHYVVPWNSLSGMDQGFQVTLDPNYYLQQAMGSTASGGGLSSLAGNLTNPTAALSDPGVIDNVMSAVRKGSDDQFIDEVAAYANGIDASRPLVLIGHSFGADSITKVLSKINRDILFVGAIDPVGSAGLRKLMKSREIPASVTYFYNRWQNGGIFPFDYVGGGSFKCSAKTCDQGKVKGVEHIDIPHAGNVEAEILAALDKVLGTGGGTASSSSSSGGGSVKDQLKGQLKGLFGN